MTRRRWTAAVLATVVTWACGEPAAGPNAALTPSFNKGGAPAWRQCFDATATPVTFGANWPLTTATGAPAPVAPTVEQLGLVASEINSTCGIRVGPGSVGSPLAFTVLDVRGGAGAQSSANTTQLIAAGAIAIIGAGGSPEARSAAQVAVQSNVPFATHQGATDAISGCTTAQLADPVVTKSATPTDQPGQCWNNGGLVFRTRSTDHGIGLAAGRYARETYPASTTAAMVFRGEAGAPRTHEAMRDAFVALGGTVLAQGGFNSPTATLDDFKTLLRTVTAGNPSIIFGTIAPATLRLLMPAYVELRDDPTWTDRPAGFAALRFVFVGTISSDNYSSVGASALAALVNQFDGIQDSWDPNSIAFQRWLAHYQSYNPNAQPNAAFFMGSYDALIVMALAVTAAGTTDPQAVQAKYREVTNPPGHVVCPGQWRKAFRFLAQGKDINYEGALSPVDLDERGNATGLVFGVFKVQPDGSVAQANRVGAAYQPACEYDDEGE